jgi:nicotinamidase-related amidase
LKIPNSPERKILFVIDMQNDFITGPLGTPEAEDIVNGVSEKIISCIGKSDHYVVMTQDTHDKDYSYTLEGMKLEVPHCIKGTEGWQIPSKLIQSDNQIILEKDTFGCAKFAALTFSNPGGDPTPIQPFRDHLEIIGVCTDICVITNALLLRTLYPNTPIRCDAALCAGTTPEKHKEALSIMESCQIEVVHKELFM